MKKIKILMFLTLLVAAGIFGYKYDLDLRKDLNRQAIKEDVKSQSDFEKLTSKVDDTAIIKKALKSVGILSVLEGVEEYKQTIEEENWYSYRGINIDWHYRFSIAMNLEDIAVHVEEGTVYIPIDGSKLVIQFIEKTRDSSSHSEASWLARKFSSQEIGALEKAVLEKVEERITGKPEYWEQARKSLETNLIKLCNDLGYYRINFVDQKKTNGLSQ